MHQQNPLTLVTPILNKRQEGLYDFLEKIKQDLLHNKHELFEDIGTIHFARWVVIDDPKATGEPTTERTAKLVFTSNFDGSADQHIKDLCTVAAPLIDRIYEACVDYPAEPARTPESRAAYLNKWVVKTTTFYRGSPNRTLKQIRQESELRNFIKGIVETGNWENKKAREVHQHIREVVFSKPEFAWAKEQTYVPGVNWLGMALVVLILLILLPLIIPFILYLHFFYERKDSVFTLKRSQVGEQHIKTLEVYEDIEFQNQFTQLVSMKPGKVRLFTFKAMMLFGRTLIRFLFVQGKLMGIPSIHFARWVLFDDNKRVLFFSNFDGSWQQYLGDFIDKSGWGLTGIFSNTTNFPKTKFLITGGAYDEEHFLAWSRYTELPTQIWYNAYPHLSIKNVNNNTFIRNQLSQNLSEKDAQKFLQQI